MLRIKPGVILKGIKPETVVGIIRVLGVFEANGEDMWLTSGLEGEHKTGSYHYTGSAFDVGVRLISPEKKQPILEQLRVALSGTEFHLYDESQTSQPHWHISVH